MAASLVAFDACPLPYANVSGTVTFSGLLIEISEDGENLLVVADAPGSAELTIGDEMAAITFTPVARCPPASTRTCA